MSIANRMESLLRGHPLTETSAASGKVEDALDDWLDADFVKPLNKALAGKLTARRGEFSSSLFVDDLEDDVLDEFFVTVQIGNRFVPSLSVKLNDATIAGKTVADVIPKVAEALLKLK